MSRISANQANLAPIQQQPSQNSPNAPAQTNVPSGVQPISGGIPGAFVGINQSSNANGGSHIQQQAQARNKVTLGKVGAGAVGIVGGAIGFVGGVLGGLVTGSGRALETVGKGVVGGMTVGHKKLPFIGALIGLAIGLAGGIVGGAVRGTVEFGASVARNTAVGYSMVYENLSGSLAQAKQAANTIKSRLGLPLNDTARASYCNAAIQKERSSQNNDIGSSDARDCRCDWNKDSPTERFAVTSTGANELPNRSTNYRTTILEVQSAFATTMELSIQSNQIWNRHVLFLGTCKRRLW